MAEVTGIVEATVMVLASKKWLLEAVAVLSLIDAVLAVAMIWGWWYLSCYSFLSVLIKIWTYL